MSTATAPPAADTLERVSRELVLGAIRCKPAKREEEPSDDPGAARRHGDRLPQGHRPAHRLPRGRHRPLQARPQDVASPDSRLPGESHADGRGAVGIHIRIVRNQHQQRWIADPDRFAFLKTRDVLALPATLGGCYLLDNWILDDRYPNVDVWIETAAHAAGR